MPGPDRPRLTHVALPVGDLEASLDWYAEWTPLRLLRRFSDEQGSSAWLAHDDVSLPPFVLVLVDFAAAHGEAHPRLAPFAHLGVELPTRADVDGQADRARRAGILVTEPIELPPPVGYVCMIADPDGNRIELSCGQGVYDAAAEAADRVAEGDA